MSQVVDEIDALHARIVAIGPLDDDILRTVFLINALGKHYPQLQSYIKATSDSPNFSSDTVLKARSKLRASQSSKGVDCRAQI